MIIIIIIKERSNTTWKGPHFFFRRPEWPRKCGICQAPEHKRHSTVGRKTRRSEAGGRLPLAPTPRPLGFSQASSLPSSPRVPNDQCPAARAPGFCAGWITHGRGANGVTSGPGVGRDHLWPRGPAQQSGRLGAGPMPAGRWPPPVQSRGYARLGSERSILGVTGRAQGPAQRPGWRHHLLEPLG